MTDCARARLEEVLTLRHLRILSFRAVTEFSEDNCTQMAAAISYYVLFSIFPLLIFSVGLLGVLLQDSDLQERLVDAVMDSIPLDEEQGRNDVSSAIENVANVGSGALGIIGLIGMAWSGSNMFGVIRRSLNLAYDIEQHRPLVRQKLLDMMMALAFLPVLFASIAATASIRAARRFTQDSHLLGDISGALGFAWEILPLLVPVTMSFLAFMFLYAYIPATRHRLGEVWLGAAVAAVLFEAGKIGFSIYLENFSNYSVVFGSLGAVAAFLFWVYISANILLFGAEIASEYPRVMRGDYDVEEPGGEKPPLRQRVKDLLLGLVLYDHEKPSSNKDET